MCRYFYLLIKKVLGSFIFFFLFVFIFIFSKNLSLAFWKLPNSHCISSHLRHISHRDIQRVTIVTHETWFFSQLHSTRFDLTRLCRFDSILAKMISYSRNVKYLSEEIDRFSVNGVENFSFEVASDSWNCSVRARFWKLRDVWFSLKPVLNVYQIVIKQLITVGRWKLIFFYYI